MHEVRRMVATLREIFMIGSSVKLLVSESIIARALNRVLRSYVFYPFLNLKNCRSPAFFTFQR